MTKFGQAEYNDFMARIFADKLDKLLKESEKQNYINRNTEDIYKEFASSKDAAWFCQYHLTHFIRTRIMQRERYDHSRAFFGLPEAAHRWRCRFFC